MKSYMEVYDMLLEKEEFISPEEFLARREAGQISLEDVEITPPQPGFPWGAFKIKLKEPRFKSQTKKDCYVR